MVNPNLRNDAHDGSLATADKWLKSWMNAVLTLVIHPSQEGHAVSEPLTHYSLTRLFEELTSTSFLNKGAGRDHELR